MFLPWGPDEARLAPPTPPPKKKARAPPGPCHRKVFDCPLRRGTTLPPMYFALDAPAVGTEKRRGENGKKVQSWDMYRRKCRRLQGLNSQTAATALDIPQERTSELTAANTHPLTPRLKLLSSFLGLLTLWRKRFLWAPPPQEFRPDCSEVECRALFPLSTAT